MQGKQPNLRELKQCVRKRILQARHAISPAERDAKSNIISDSLFTKIDNLYTIFSNSTHIGPFTIALYCAMDEEVSLARFIQRAQEREWALCFPCMIKPEGAGGAGVGAGGTAIGAGEVAHEGKLGAKAEGSTDGKSASDAYADAGSIDGLSCRNENARTGARSMAHESMRETQQASSNAEISVPAFPEQPSQAHPKTRNTMHFVELNAASVQRKSLEFLAHPARAYTHAAIEQQIALDSYTTHTRWVQPHEFHAIVVPVVGFDDNNMRLGYGQGNYDEFLVQCAPQASIIGVAFKEQHVECVYPEAHDVALPSIIVG